MSEQGKKIPGNGLLGWLGRQVGHIAKAVRTDVMAGAGGAAKTVYRDCRVQEQALPQNPEVVLRRTVIDEVVVESPKEPGGA